MLAQILLYYQDHKTGFRGWVRVVEKKYFVSDCNVGTYYILHLMEKDI
jgi:hypothetical protein